MFLYGKIYHMVSSDFLFPPEVYGNEWKNLRAIEKRTKELTGEERTRVATALGRKGSFLKMWNWGEFNSNITSSWV